MGLSTRFDDTLPRDDKEPTREVGDAKQDDCTMNRGRSIQIDCEEPAGNMNAAILIFEIRASEQSYLKEENRTRLMQCDSTLSTRRWNREFIQQAIVMKEMVSQDHTSINEVEPRTARRIDNKCRKIHAKHIRRSLKV